MSEVHTSISAVSRAANVFFQLHNNVVPARVSSSQIYFDLFHCSIVHVNGHVATTIPFVTAGVISLLKVVDRPSVFGWSI